MNASGSLSGLRVLVTRPAHQAGPLCRAIEAAGGHALHQPLLKMAAPNDLAAAELGLAQAADAQDLIFTSANAVDWAWQLVPSWSPQGRAFAVGLGTARALEQRLRRDVRIPAADYSSEGVLALPEMQQPQGRTISLITGEGGRGMMADVLPQRGAQVQVVAVYRRETLPLARHRLSALLSEADVIFVSSGGSLQHLVDITPIGQRKSLFKLQLVVSSSRVLKLALELGFLRSPLVPARMQDDAIVATLQDWSGRPQARR